MDFNKKLTIILIIVTIILSYSCEYISINFYGGEYEGFTVFEFLDDVAEDSFIYFPARAFVFLMNISIIASLVGVFIQNKLGLQLMILNIIGNAIYLFIFSLIVNFSGSSYSVERSFMPYLAIVSAYCALASSD